MLNPLRRQTVDGSPGALAAELADARVAFETTRASIIERAITRQNAIMAMIQELQEENSELAGVTADAGVTPFNYEDEPSLS